MSTENTPEQRVSRMKELVEDVQTQLETETYDPASLREITEQAVELRREMEKAKTVEEVTEEKRSDRKYQMI